MYSCDQPLSFSTSHEHYLYGGPPTSSYPNGYVEAQGRQERYFWTNTGVDDNFFADESRPGSDNGTLLCTSWPCDPVASQMHPQGQPPLTYNGSAQMIVGHHYDIAADLRLFTQGYDNVGVYGEATIDEFSFDVTPGAGAEGIDLAYGPAPAGDTTAPVLAGLQDITVPAGPGGTATATWTVTATDETDPNPTVSCVPPSGSSFPLGTTTVNCSASDAAGNTSTGSFTVTVTDGTAPVLAGIQDITAIAGPDGKATPTWTVTATDDVDLNPTVSCSPHSGSAFGFGQTTVTCTATDAAGNASTGSFRVTVLDQTPPVLTGAQDVTVPAGPNGTGPMINVTAADNVDPAPVVTCTPSLPRTFPVGATPGDTARDASGNVASGSFTVTVTPITDPMGALRLAIQTGTMSPLLRAGLQFGQRGADYLFRIGRAGDACTVLRAMDTAVSFAPGGSISSSTASIVRALIRQVRVAHGWR